MAQKLKEKKMLSAEEIEEILDDLERKLDRVKTLYDSYFMGIEKIEPQTARREVVRKIQELREQHIRNSGLRFRFNMLAQKLGVMQTLWSRTMREIEAGTYKPHVDKAARMLAKKGVAPEEVARVLGVKGLRKKHITDEARAAKEALDLTRRKRREDAGVDALAAASSVEEVLAIAQARARAGEAPAQVAPPPAGPPHTGEFDDMLNQLFSDGESPFPPSPTAMGPRPPMPPPAAPPAQAAPRTAKETLPMMGSPPPRPAPPRVTPPPGMTDDQMQALYKKYQQARRMVGQDAEGVKYESLVAQLAKQTPGILKQHGAAAVDFAVVVRDNKVVLKAVPKK